MTTEKLLEIAGAALCDTLCEGCEIEDTDVFGSCYECRVQALTEIVERLRGYNAIVLGKKYPTKEYTVTMTRDNGENMFEIKKAESKLTPKQGIQGR